MQEIRVPTGPPYKYTCNDGILVPDVSYCIGSGTGQGYGTGNKLTFRIIPPWQIRVDRIIWPRFIPFWQDKPLWMHSLIVLATAIALLLLGILSVRLRRRLRTENREFRRAVGLLIESPPSNLMYRLAARRASRSALLSRVNAVSWAKEVHDVALEKLSGEMSNLVKDLRDASVELEWTRSQATEFYRRYQRPLTVLLGTESTDMFCKAGLSWRQGRRLVCPELVGFGDTRQGMTALFECDMVLSLDHWTDALDVLSIYLDAPEISVEETERGRYLLALNDSAQRTVEEDRAEDLIDALSESDTDESGPSSEVEDTAAVAVVRPDDAVEVPAGPDRKTGGTERRVGTSSIRSTRIT